ncbi:MAG: enterotoxin [Paludibacter sp.]|nr:enterotoxin [Paludibacter sp.]
MRPFFLASIFSIFLSSLFAQPLYTGESIGSAQARVNNDFFEVKNNTLEAKWVVINQVVHAQSFLNKETNQIIDWKQTPWFYLELENGECLTSNDFKVIESPIVSLIKKEHGAIKVSDHFDGKKISSDFYNEESGLKIHWEVSLKDGSNYLIQRFTLSVKDSLRVDKIGLIEFPYTSGLKITGIVDGSPLAGNNFFCALEHPMSKVVINKNLIVSFIKRYQGITKSEPLIFSTVWGVSSDKQLRRSFLYYLERERAVPYHQQLHYNSWFDISFGDRKLDETSCLDRIQTFADSLIVKRKIKMDAFLFDDGWDDNQTLWEFNSGFPNGFTKMSELAKKYQSSLGVWISPWGGYDEAKIQRLAYGQKQIPPFETNSNGFSLSGSNYYKRFIDVASDFVKNQGVSMFKFDGVGLGNDSEGANASYEKDINALLKLIPDLRKLKPDLYFSLTVGTWPSPYWLFYGDAIWRNGDDTGLTGVGSKRQQWITFRDAEAYKNIVKRGFLYPLNSLMYHGVCIADNGTPGTLNMSDKDMSDEIWSFFGTGTSLQELYINPHKLNKATWDCLAKAIHWAKVNEDIMVDTHWVGGSPADTQIYGFASWSPKKGILMLRNPSTEKQSFTINVAEIFEIPENINIEYNFFDARSKNILLPIGKGSSFQIDLKPFEVKVMNAVPVK